MKKIPFLSKKIEYMTFKTQIMPRLLIILTQHEAPLNLKEKGCEVLIEILSVLDRNFLRDNILKTLQSLRENINEPAICMHLLTLYSGIASALTPEDIGNKILPGLIPMLISASFTKTQFNRLIGTIRTLIDQLEKHRLKDLNEMDPLGDAEGAKAKPKQDDMFSGLSGNFDDPMAALPPQENEGDFDFLSVLEGTSKKQTPKASGIESAHSKTPQKDPFSDFGGSSFPAPTPTPHPAKTSNQSDIFKGLGQSKPNVPPPKSQSNMSLSKKPQNSPLDPFDTSGPMKPLSKPSHSTAGVKDDIFGDMDPFSTSKGTTSDPFSNFGASHPVQDATGISTPTINMTSGFKSLKDGADPFADILGEEKKEPSMGGGFGGFDSGISFTSGFGGPTQTQQKKQAPPLAGFTSKPAPSQKSSDPFSGLGGFGSKPQPPKPQSTGTGFGSSGTNGNNASSGFSFGGGSTSNQFNNSFSSVGSNNSSFGGSSGFGGGFQPQPQSTPQPGGFAFPSGIDMNAPMDQNTMNMMMNMMSNFQQQMSGAPSSQPQWGHPPPQSQNSSGSKPPFNSKGIFD